MKTALMLGATKGLGLELSKEALLRNVKPIVVGRIIEPAVANPELTGASFKKGDIATAHIPELNTGEIFHLDYVFWIAGIFKRIPIHNIRPEHIDNLINTHCRGPLHLIREIQTLRTMKNRYGKTFKPYHFVTIASTSSYRMRDNESVYCGLKGFKAQFTRNFARELAQEVPGSKTTLVNPGGMKTLLFEEIDQDISKFMDPAEVAKIIWNEVLRQEQFFLEVNIERDENGNPIVSYGPKTPEVPSL